MRARKGWITPPPPRHTLSRVDPRRRETPREDEDEDARIGRDAIDRRCAARGDADDAPRQVCGTRDVSQPPTWMQTKRRDSAERGGEERGAHG